MMTIGLHLRIIGRPGRMAGLEAVLRHVAPKHNVWIVRRDDIARRWTSMHGAEGNEGE